MSSGSSPRSGSTPVLLVPANLTKHLKIALDTAGWRDKSKLITRHAQLIQGTQPQQHNNTHTDSPDLSKHMAMALLPVEPFLAPHTSNQPPTLLSLSDFVATLADQPSQTSNLDTLRTMVPDQTLQSTLFVAWLDSSAFATPRHLLALTPLEKLKENLSRFLAPYLPSYLDSLDQQEPQQTSPELLQTLISSIPQKWEHYSDFTLLPPTTFQIAPWPQVLEHLIALDGNSTSTTERTKATQEEEGPRIMDRLEKLVQEALQSDHIARKAIIPVQDVLRRPQIRPLTGNWGLHNRYKSWVEESNMTLLKHQEKTNTMTAATTSPQDDDEQGDLVAPTTENFQRAYWAETCQNQVWYRWSPMFTMFSAGNITEKERVAHSRPIFDARGKVVVDLYAGIGYFTLVYLVHAGASTVHACEWNPWSVQGLKQGAERNGIAWSSFHKVVDQDEERSKTIMEQSSVVQKKKKKYVAATKDNTFAPAVQTQEQQQRQQLQEQELGNLIIYSGDNAQWIDRFENQAHHINLGLIPSAEPGWVLGVRALCPDQGGYLHVHHNIRVGEEEIFKNHLLQSLRELFKTWKSSMDGNWSIEIRHWENVKSFAPLVFHYVVDVECRPPRWSSIPVS
ncbi:tRNA methyltransferase tyw3 [Gryganskiella cystojenkinii]|nr:tRNA methyltransferase tyw3 [Gryganskiella cystojenkinii]